MLQDSALCSLCTCQVPGCLRPRNGVDLCKTHQRVLASLPISSQLTRAARGHLAEMLPPDVVGFVRRAPSVQNDFALSLLLASIQEPEAVSVFCDHLAQLDAGFEASTLLSVLEAVVPAATEASQLVPQGAPRRSDDPTPRYETPALRPPWEPLLR